MPPERDESQISCYGFHGTGIPRMSLQTLDRADVKDGFISGVASTPSTDAFGHSVCAGAF